MISIHALREEGDCLHGFKLTGHGNFNPRPPRGGRPLIGVKSSPVCMISIHALREEGDTLTVRQTHPASDFNPRPPRGGRPGVICTPRIAQWISIHALREEGDCAILSLLHLWHISIHALREEGDMPRSTPTSAGAYFNPRPPRGGRPDAGQCAYHILYFNPRPPRGGRRTTSRRACTAVLISIHALREEGDYT